MLFTLEFWHLAPPWVEKYFTLFMYHSPGNRTGFDNGGVVIIPAGHCWVEGDNQELSVDSRKYGPVSYGLIFAKVTSVIYPIHRIRRLDTTSDSQAYISSTRVIGSGGIPTNYS